MRNTWCDTHMNKHSKFILRPSDKILDDAASAINGITGITRVPLNEYFMQSVFLKLTGEQEQKMKCICWDLATDDYDYRYERYSKGWTLGECSRLEDKKTVYNDLYKRITGLSIDDTYRENIINETDKMISNFYSIAKLDIGNQRAYDDYQKLLQTIQPIDLLKISKEGKVQLLSDKVKDMYDALYRHRNRCAHNTLSYQEHPFSFNKLSAKEYRFENYFLRFAILIMIDKMFVDAYKHYVD